MHEGHRERMRERLYFHGDSMSDHELLETLLYYTVPRKNTNPTAHELIDRFGSLAGVFAAPAESLEQIAGVGRKTAEFIRLVGILQGRLRVGGERTYLKNQSDAVDFARRRLAGRSDEALEVYCLGARGALLCVKTYESGSGAQVSLDSRSLSRLFASVQPLSVLVAHNHPSGRCEPSAEDDAAVSEVYKICRINGVQLADCLVLAEDASYSYFHNLRFERLGIDRDRRDPYIVMK